MLRLPKTLAMRLTLLYAAIFAALSSVAFVVAYLWIAANMDARVEADLREDVAEFRALLASEGLESVKREISRELSEDASGQTVLRLLKADGTPLMETDIAPWTTELWNASAYAKIAEGLGPELKTATEPLEAEKVRLIVDVIKPGLLIEIGESLEEKEELLELLLGTFAAIIAAVIIVAVIVGRIMSRTALQGVDEITQAAEDVARGNFDRRVAVEDRGKEIDRLTATFNIMVDRVRALILEMQVMTDNIAHDLRSPLTRLRATVERALLGARSLEDYKNSAEETLEECDRLLQMINTTLDVTEAEGGVAPVSKQNVDLADVIREAAELFEPVAEDREIELSLKLDSDCHIHGNLQHLQRMVANLLDNAIKYTEASGSVTVELSRSNGFVSMSISDTGIGIDPRFHTRIFDRFFRCDQSRSKQGFGLGLSFVRAVAKAHKGKVELESKLNEGSRFIVSMPALST